MDVQFYVRADGTLVGKGVLWSPPVKSRSIRKPELSDLDLLIGFDDASQAGLGAPTSMGTAILASNVDVLDKAIAKLVVDGAAPAETTFGVRDTRTTAPHYRAADFGSEVARTIGSPGSKARGAELLVTSETNETLVSIVYDLAGVGERDRLFRRAWADARSKLRRPMQCEKTSGDGGLDIGIPFPVP